MGTLVKAELDPGGRMIKLVKKMKPTTATKKTRNRRFARGPEGGMIFGSEGIYLAPLSSDQVPQSYPASF